MGMIAKSKFNHTAAGLLSKFVSRNNDYQGYWALGVLYTEARASGLRVELDLLHGQALPEAPACVSVARSHATFLRNALARHGATPGMLSSASLALVFDLLEPRMPAGGSYFGDRVECILTIALHDGRTVTRRASTRCAPHDSRIFRRATALREAEFRLHQQVILRNKDCDGRWSLDVLREAYPNVQELVFDLLRECAVPPHAAGDAVARVYAGRLRSLLGEWMSDLDTAEIRLRFSTLPNFPGASVFAESRFGTRDRYVTWHNGSAPIMPEEPQQEAP